MQFYKYSTIRFLLIVMYIHTIIFTCNARPRKTKTITVKNTNTQSTKQVIIFDLTNVLLKENQIGFAKKIGYGKLASYTLTHWKNPGYRCLDMLATMSNHETQKPHITITINNRRMPRCLVELQEGKKNCAQIKTEILQGIDMLDTQKFFTSAKEKKLMTNIMKLVLDPDTVTTIIEPVKPTVQLVQKLKAAGHLCYGCGNAPEELYTATKNKLSEVIDLFDGIFISSQAQSVKPEPEIYNQLIAMYNLTPAHCIAIEDLEASAATARKLGMQAIVFNKPSHLTKQLKKCGVNV